MHISKKRITPIAAGILLALSSTQSSAVITLNFSNSTVAGVQGTDFNYSVCGAVTDKAGTEFRMCDPSGATLGGGLPLKKDTINGAESWEFNDSGTLTGVTNTGVTGGLSATSIGYNIPSADPAGGTAIDQGADFFGNAFAFLAPFTGSNAATVYGEGQLTLSGATGSFILFFPVLEAQWSGTSFPLGEDGGSGITFFGTIDPSSVVTGASDTTFNYSMWAEHTITANEDPGSAGFSTWTPQWYYVGDGSAPNSAFDKPDQPRVAAGNINPTPGGPGVGNDFNDGRITLAEVLLPANNIGIDNGADKENGITNQCSGGCFDFTVDSITGNAIITLPLTAPIPTNPVYRKYNNTLGWHDFDTSGTDTIESAPADAVPTVLTSISCVSTIFTPGLTPGNSCVRLTIADGGPNDIDGTVNGDVVDPGGVASAPPIPFDPIIPGESISGCSISNTPVNANNHTEWWLVAAFLTLLGFRKKLKHN